MAESALVAVSMVFGKALSLVWKIITARQGSSAVGEIEFILTTTNLLAALAILGLPMTVTIWTAKDQPKQSIQRNFLLDSLVFALISGTALAITAQIIFSIWPNLISKTQILPSTYLWSVPLIGIGEILWAWFNGRKQYLAFAFGKYIGQPLFRLASLAIMIALGIGWQNWIPQHLNSAVIGVCLVTAILATKAWKKLQSPVGITLWSKVRKNYWHQSFLLSGSLALYVLYSSSDVYWLTIFHGPAVVGIFSLLLALATLLELVFLPILNLLQTRLGAFQNQPTKGFNFAIKNGLISLSLGVIGSLLLLVFKPWIVLLFGNTGSVIITSQLAWLLIWKLVANSWVLPIRHFLDFFGFQKQTLWAMSLSFLFKIMLSWLLVPKFAITGIIAANIGAEILHSISLIVILKMSHLFQSIQKSPEFLPAKN